MIITDRYKLTLTNVGNTICQAIEERVGDQWVPLANIPLHWRDHAEPLWRELDANIDDCVMREEAEKDPDEKPKEDPVTDTDFWSCS